MKTLRLCFVSFSIWLLLGLSKAYEDLKSMHFEGQSEIRPLYLRPRILDIDFRCTKQNDCNTQVIASESYTFEMEPKSKLSVSIDLSNLIKIYAINRNLERVKGDIVIYYKSDTEALQVRREIQLSYSDFRVTLLNTMAGKEWNLTILKQDFGVANQLIFSEINLSKSKTIVEITMIFESKELEDSSSSRDSYTSASIIVIIISSIGGIIFTLVVMGFYYWVKYRRQRRTNINSRGTRHFVANNSSEASKKLAHGDPLTLENLNERFPDRNFEETKSSFPQSTCSICLGELQEGNICRQLYCEHIFHSECVKIWLEKQLEKGTASCPNCKRSVMGLDPTVSKSTE